MSWLVILIALLVSGDVYVGAKRWRGRRKR